MIEVEHLEDYHPLGRAERYMFIGTEGIWANLTAVDGRALWRLSLVGSEERLAPEKLDVDAIMRRAMGNDRGEWTVRRVMPWRRSQFTADRYVDGRIVLAGDAAHTTSPTGGHGLNTGIGDISDLGWMLDALLRGWGGDRLLAAYNAERRPVAIRNGTSSTKNYGAWVQAVGRDLVLVLDVVDAAGHVAARLVQALRHLGPDRVAHREREDRLVLDLLRHGHHGRRADDRERRVAGLGEIAGDARDQARFALGVLQVEGHRARSDPGLELFLERGDGLADDGGAYQLEDADPQRLRGCCRGAGRSGH